MIHETQRAHRIGATNVHPSTEVTDRAFIDRLRLQLIQLLQARRNNGRRTGISRLGLSLWLPEHVNPATLSDLLSYPP